MWIARRWRSETKELERKNENSLLWETIGGWETRCESGYIYIYIYIGMCGFVLETLHVSRKCPCGCFIAATCGWPASYFDAYTQPFSSNLGSPQRKSTSQFHTASPPTHIPQLRYRLMTSRMCVIRNTFRLNDWTNGWTHNWMNKADI